MLKALIADDEPLMRKGIENATDWSSHGIQKVISASNGREALALIEQHNPDLLITDVRMPGIDGLELSRLVRASWPHTKIIIISGFDEFAYAQKSIAYGVSDYILKPIDGKILNEAVHKVVLEIREERFQHEELSRVSHKLLRTTGMARQKFLRELISGESKNAALVNDLHLLDLDRYHNRDLVMAIIKINSFKEKSMLFKDGGLLHFAVQNILKEIVNARGCGELVDLHLVSMFLLIDMEKMNESGSLDEFVMEAQKTVNRFLRIQTTWGIGGIYRGLEKLHMSYLEAENAIKLRWFEDASTIFRATDSIPAPPLTIPAQEVKLRVSNQLRIGETKSYHSLLNEAFQELLSGNARQPQSIEAYFLELAGMLANVLNEMQLNADHSVESQVTEAIYLSDSLSDLIESLQKIFNQALVPIQQPHRKSYSKVIREAIAFLKKNYQSDISLAGVASHVYLNRSYLSYLFVQETGNNFSDLLVAIRLDKAKELLLNTSMKNYEIAEAVGYKNFRHFGQTFKKLTGVSPGDFRQIGR